MDKEKITKPTNQESNLDYLKLIFSIKLKKNYTVPKQRVLIILLKLFFSKFQS